MSFNFIPVTLDDEIRTENLPIFCEFARNLNTLELLTQENKFYPVYKNDALKIWILKALHFQTVRYEHRAYSSDYGNEITKLFGRNLSDSILKSELQRYVEETLLQNPYIKKIDNFVFKKQGSKVSATFMVTTIYGEFEQIITYEKE